MSAPHWLTAILPSKESVAGTKSGEWIYRPWLYQSDIVGTMWTAATDGKIMVWLKGEHAGAQRIGAKDRVPVSDFFEPKGSRVATMQIADLQAWCGPWQKEQPCPSCDGKVKDNEYLYCSFCDGDGVVGPDVQPGYLCGVPMDRNRMALVIHHVGGQCKVWCDYRPKATNGRPENNPVYLIGDGWRFVQCPMEVTSSRGTDWDAAPWLGPLNDRLMSEYRSLLANKADMNVIADWCSDHGWPAMEGELRRRSAAVPVEKKRIRFAKRSEV